MSAVHPSLQLLHVQLLFPFLMAMELTLHMTGSSTNSCISVEIAGSSTNGTRKRNAKMHTMHAVPRKSDA